jgi:hypothetical protein
MTLRRAWILGFLAFAGLIVLLLTFARRRGEPYLAEVPLSDGRHKLRLLQMTDGPLIYDWKDPTPGILRAVMPSKVLPPWVPFNKVSLSGKAPLSAFDSDSEVDGSSFLFRAVDLKGRYANPQLLNPAVEFQESTGFVHLRKVFGGMEFSPWGVIAFTRTSLPRRDARLHMHIYERPDSAKPIEMEVDNPWYQQHFPVWQGSTLPVSTTVGPLTVTLESLVLREATRQIEPRVEVSKPGWQAEPFGVWLEDATGNRAQWLSPFEPAWRVHLRIGPTSFAEADAARLWTLENLDVPKLDAKMSLDQETVIDGVTIRLDTVSGGITSRQPAESPSSSPSKRRISDDNVPAETPFIHVTASAAHRNFSIIPRVLDGKEVLMMGYSQGIGRNSIELTVPFRRPPDGHKIRVELVCMPIHAVEFLVTPPVEFRTEMLNVERQR